MAKNSCCSRLFIFFLLIVIITILRQLNCIGHTYIKGLLSFDNDDDNDNMNVMIMMGIVYVMLK